MSMSSGVFDLSSLKAPSPGAAAPSASGEGPAGSVYSIEVTTANFPEVVQSSTRHLVVMGLWSPRSPQSIDFMRLLVDATAGFEGAIGVGLVDVDAEPEIGQALGIQGVPVTVGLVGGRPVPLFQGTVPAEEIARYFAELHRLGVQSGLAGRAQPGNFLPGVATPDEVHDEVEEPADPRFEAADAAWAAGDFATAVDEYEKLAAQHPGEVEIAERLAGVKLMARTQGVDLQAARTAAADNPQDLAAALLVADLDVAGGHVEDAFGRLIELVKHLGGDDRDLVRERLLELFTVVGPGDPRVAVARRALATALY
jgi:putative thioredoxin